MIPGAESLDIDSLRAHTQKWSSPEAGVTLIAWEPEGMVCAEHNGYAGRGVTLRRAVWLLESGEWVILDRLAAADGEHAGEHTYQHRLHSRLLEWETARLSDAEGSGDAASSQASRYYLNGSDLGGWGRHGNAIGCELLIFGPAGLALDVEESWESVQPMTMTPLKVLQGFVASTSGAWFATVLKPHDGCLRLNPAAWSVQTDDGRGIPALQLRQDGRTSVFRMPE